MNIQNLLFCFVLLIISFSPINGQSENLVEDYAKAICDKVASKEFIVKKGTQPYFVLINLVLQEIKVRNPELIASRSGQLFPGLDEIESGLFASDISSQLLRICPEVRIAYAASTLAEIDEKSPNPGEYTFSSMRQMNRSEWKSFVDGFSSKVLNNISKDLKRTVAESVHYHIDLSGQQLEFYSIPGNGQFDFVEIFTGIVAQTHPEITARYIEEKKTRLFGLSYAAEQKMKPAYTFFSKHAKERINGLSSETYGPTSEIKREIFGDIFGQEVADSLSEIMGLKTPIAPKAFQTYFEITLEKLISYDSDRNSSARKFLMPYLIQKKLTFGPPVTEQQVKYFVSLKDRVCAFQHQANRKLEAVEQVMKDEQQKIQEMFPIRARTNQERFMESIGRFLKYSGRVHCQ